MALWLVSCGSSVEFTKEEFDTELWKNDRQGCQGLRKNQLENFQKIKTKLYELSERDIRQVLGKPDQVDLYKRKQKFYVYFVEKGIQCEGGASETQQAERIEIRFSALERVNEIIYRPAMQ